MAFHLKKSNQYAESSKHALKQNGGGAESVVPGGFSTKGKINVRFVICLIKKFCDSKLHQQIKVMPQVWR